MASRTTIFEAGVRSAQAVVPGSGVLGKIHVQVEYRVFRGTLSLLVVGGEGASSLARDWFDW